MQYLSEKIVRREVVLRGDLRYLSFRREGEPPPTRGQMGASEKAGFLLIKTR
jgi:hypothetical protein